MHTTFVSVKIIARYGSEVLNKKNSSDLLDA